MRKLLIATLVLIVSSPVLAGRPKIDCQSWADVAEIFAKARQDGAPRLALVQDVETTKTPEKIKEMYIAIINRAYLEPLQVSKQAKQRAITNHRIWWLDICAKL